jgi:hypothetical protein
MSIKVCIPRSVLFHGAPTRPFFQRCTLGVEFPNAQRDAAPCACAAPIVVATDTIFFHCDLRGRRDSPGFAGVIDLRSWYGFF